MDDWRRYRDRNDPLVGVHVVTSGLPVVTATHEVPTVSTECVLCHGLVTLQCELSTATASETMDQTWLCPWCWGSNAAMLRDQLVWVGERQPPEPTVRP